MDFEAIQGILSLVASMANDKQKQKREAKIDPLPQASEQTNERTNDVLERDWVSVFCVASVLCCSRSIRYSVQGVRDLTDLEIVDVRWIISLGRTLHRSSVCFQQL